MTANPTSSTLAVTLISLGSLLMMGATACLLALHEPAWRGVLLVGAVVHAAGWLLPRRNRPAPATSDEESDADEDDRWPESFVWEYGDLRNGREGER
ncbi:hypothetical protein [Streptomyces sp. NPDC016845]|uniref:hypothetical protein n=1 Tax=Streptomyces sp. NPDC016845 TaxID=3364972 RepID=UPI0037B6C23C